MKTKFYLIAISFGQNTEYWNSSFINDEYTTKNPESAEGFETMEEAENALENFVKPYGLKKGWNVSFSIDEL